MLNTNWGEFRSVANAVRRGPAGQMQIPADSRRGPPKTGAGANRRWYHRVPLAQRCKNWAVSCMGGCVGGSPFLFYFIFSLFLVFPVKVFLYFVVLDPSFFVSSFPSGAAIVNNHSHYSPTLRTVLLTSILCFPLLLSFRQGLLHRI